MDDQRPNSRAERRTGFEPGWCGGGDGLAAAGAGPAVAMNAGDDGADRRQVDMIIGVDVSDVGRSKRMVAMRA